MKTRKRLLFICLGNICRSPAAQAVMEKMIDDRKMTDRFEVDSAGIGGWHIGQLGDQRMRRMVASRGYSMTHHARQFDADSDFDRFDLILTMDDENYRIITRMARNDHDRAKVKPLTQFMTKHEGVDEIPDPYYGGERDFAWALDLIEDGCSGLLDTLTWKPRLIILDFDGTIGDTNQIITQTMQQTLQEMHLDVKSAEECSRTIGLPLQQCFSALMPMTDETAAKCAEVYRRIFAERCANYHIPVFPHVVETLRRWHREGILLTIASSRCHASLQNFVDDLGLADVFALLLGADDVKRAKPDPWPVTHTLHILGVEAKDALVVGDMSFDIIMGDRAGCKTCGVTYGNGTREELIAAGADRVVDRFDDIAD
ncbi:MAG: HAD hydrolase-like protein [Prevotella sp.]|jgi:phosphoglycolate phosphatase